MGFLPSSWPQTKPVGSPWQTVFRETRRIATIRHSGFDLLSSFVICASEFELKRGQTPQRGLKGQQLKAGWDHGYLLPWLAF